MSENNSLPLFMLATLTLNVSPGPNMLYVTMRSSSKGRSADMVSALCHPRGLCCTQNSYFRNQRVKHAHSISFARAFQFASSYS
jgi:hypothetical protein